jgi:hypothetical protein
MNLSRITTKDILAVMVVSATLVFNGISLTTGQPLDPTTIGFAGIIIGHYFRQDSVPFVAPIEEPLAPPAIADDDDE